MTKVGHNTVAADQLRSIVSRVERLEEEKAGIAADIRDVFAEAKANGYDVKAIRSIIKLRKLGAKEREEQESTLDTYKHALGMQMSLDLDDESGEESGDDDKLYAEAVEIVRDDRVVSVSFLQRAMTIGHTRAEALIERMEREGIVSPANHLGRRDVLSAGEAA